jgi:hypothetical protein
MNEDPLFEGMTKQEFELLAQEAMTIQHQAHLMVLSGLVLYLLKRQGVVSIEGMKVDDCIAAKTRETVRVLLPTMADHTPTRAAQLSKFLESLDFYKTPPAA